MDSLETKQTLQDKRQKFMQKKFSTFSKMLDEFKTLLSLHNGVDNSSLYSLELLLNHLQKNTIEVEDLKIIFSYLNGNRTKPHIKKSNELHQIIKNSILKLDVDKIDSVDRIIIKEQSVVFFKTNKVMLDEIIQHLASSKKLFFKSGFIQTKAILIDNWPTLEEEVTYISKFFYQKKYAYQYVLANRLSLYVDKDYIHNTVKENDDKSFESVLRHIVTNIVINENGTHQIVDSYYMDRAYLLATTTGSIASLQEEAINYIINNKIKFNRNIYNLEESDRLSKSLEAYSQKDYGSSLFYSLTLLESFIRRQVKKTVKLKEEGIELLLLRDLLPYFRESLSDNNKQYVEYMQYILIKNSKDKTGLNIRNDIFHGFNYKQENKINSLLVLSIAYNLSLMLHNNETFTNPFISSTLQFDYLKDFHDRPHENKS